MSKTDSQNRTEAPPYHQLWVLSLSPIDEVFVRGLTVINRQQPDFCSHLFSTNPAGFMEALDNQEMLVAIARALTQRLGGPIYIYQINANANFFPFRQSIAGHLRENEFYFHLHDDYRRYVNELTIFIEVAGTEQVFITTSDTLPQDVLMGIEITLESELPFSNPRGIRQELSPSSQSIEFSPPEPVSAYLQSNLPLLRIPTEPPRCFGRHLMHFNRAQVASHVGREINIANTGITQLLLENVV